MQHFIVLKKAYDSLWRTGLFYILLEQGLPKKIFNVIYSMYADTKSRIKISDGVSKSFLSKRGANKDDVLSPMLFNIFINNIVEKLVMRIQFWLVTSLSIVCYMQTTLYFYQVVHVDYKHVLIPYMNFVHVGN
jgi:hypothetical protein